MSKHKDGNVIVTTVMPEEIKSALEIIAAQTEHSVSHHIRKAVQAYLKEKGVNVGDALYQ